MEADSTTVVRRRSLPSVGARASVGSPSDRGECWCAAGYVWPARTGPCRPEVRSFRLRDAGEAPLGGAPSGGSVQRMDSTKTRVKILVVRRPGPPPPDRGASSAQRNGWSRRGSRPRTPRARCSSASRGPGSYSAALSARASVCATTRCGRNRGIGQNVMVPQSPPARYTCTRSAKEAVRFDPSGRPQDPGSAASSEPRAAARPFRSGKAPRWRCGVAHLSFAGLDVAPAARPCAPQRGVSGKKVYFLDDDTAKTYTFLRIVRRKGILFRGAGP